MFLFSSSLRKSKETGRTSERRWGLGLGGGGVRGGTGGWWTPTLAYLIPIWYARPCSSLIRERERETSDLAGLRLVAGVCVCGCVRRRDALSLSRCKWHQRRPDVDQPGFISTAALAISSAGRTNKAPESHRRNRRNPIVDPNPPSWTPVAPLTIHPFLLFLFFFCFAAVLSFCRNS